MGENPAEYWGNNDYGNRKDSDYLEREKAVCHDHILTMCSSCDNFSLTSGSL
jgi:hypothetical protein